MKIGIPILSEIWDGTRFIINFFFDKIPRPLQFLIFLLFLILFGSVVSIFLHFSGIHCNTDKEIVKVDLIDFTTNLMVFREVTTGFLTDEEYEIGDIHRYNRLAGVDCVYLLDDSSGEHEFCDNITNPNCEYYYRNSECFDCTSVYAGFVWDEGSFFPTNVGDVCDGDALPIEWTTFQRWFDCERLCQIPEHFRFYSANGTYTCAEGEYCGENKTKEPNTRLDEILLDADASLIYTTEGDYSYKNLIKLKCTNNFNPRLTFYGIDLFDYKIWLFLAVISLLVMFLLKLNTGNN